jgi:hypothetical protein
MHIVAILDWEGACFLPLISSCTPPKALFPCQVRDLVPESANYHTYYNRSMRYTEVFSTEANKALVKSSSFSTVASRMRLYLDDDSVLLIWALDDVRTVDAVVWQHLAWRMFPNLKAMLDTTLAQFPDGEERARAVVKLFSGFSRERLIATSGNPKEQELWIKAKLSVTKHYKRQVRAYSNSNK